MQLQYVQLHIIITTAAYLIVVSSICLRDSSFKSLSFQQMMATPFSPPAPPALHVKAKNNFLCLINDLHLSSGRLFYRPNLLLLFENADRVLESHDLRDDVLDSDKFRARRKNTLWKEGSFYSRHI